MKRNPESYGKKESFPNTDFFCQKKAHQIFFSKLRYNHLCLELLRSIFRIRIYEALQNIWAAQEKNFVVQFFQNLTERHKPLKFKIKNPHKSFSWFFFPEERFWKINFLDYLPGPRSKLFKRTQNLGNVFKGVSMKIISLEVTKKKTEKILK